MKVFVDLSPPENDLRRGEEGERGGEGGKKRRSRRNPICLKLIVASRAIALCGAKARFFEAGAENQGTGKKGGGKGPHLSVPTAPPGKSVGEERKVRTNSPTPLGGGKNEKGKKGRPCTKGKAQEFP